MIGYAQPNFSKLKKCSFIIHFFSSFSLSFVIIFSAHM